MASDLVPSVSTLLPSANPSDVIDENCKEKKESLFPPPGRSQLRPLLALEAETDVEGPFHCDLTWRWSLPSPRTSF
uniref:Uncharacterized protein n=1 Tax=Hyaloperonospora arabidopsidis (strain Emoy2) TaxID=559515 RepID=M4BC65_HYAAE